MKRSLGNRLGGGGGSGKAKYHKKILEKIPKQKTHGELYKKKKEITAAPPECGWGGGREIFARKIKISWPFSELSKQKKPGQK